MRTWHVSTIQVIHISICYYHQFKHAAAIHTSIHKPIGNNFSHFDSHSTVEIFPRSHKKIFNIRFKHEKLKSNPPESAWTSSKPAWTWTQPTFKSIRCLTWSSKPSQVEANSKDLNPSVSCSSSKNQPIIELQIGALGCFKIRTDTHTHALKSWRDMVTPFHSVTYPINLNLNINQIADIRSPWLSSREQWRNSRASHSQWTAHVGR